MSKIIRYETSRVQGVWFGRTAETGVWRSGKSRRRMLWRGHDSLFIAAGHWRLRLMKPRWMS